jgi:hypothetical protein
MNITTTDCWLDNHRRKTIKMYQSWYHGVSPICEDHASTLIDILKEFKDIFAWTYKDLKGILREIAWHRIELDTLTTSSSSLVPIKSKICCYC